MGGAGHPLVAHLVGPGAVEVLLRGGLGFCLGGVQGRHATGVGLCRSNELNARGDRDHAEQLRKPPDDRGLQQGHVENNFSAS